MFKCLFYCWLSRHETARKRTFNTFSPETAIWGQQINLIDVIYRHAALAQAKNKARNVRGLDNFHRSQKRVPLFRKLRLRFHIALLRLAWVRAAADLRSVVSALRSRVESEFNVDSKFWVKATIMHRSTCSRWVKLSTLRNSYKMLANNAIHLSFRRN